MGSEDTIAKGFYLNNIIKDKSGNTKYIFSSLDGSETIDLYTNELQEKAKEGNIGYVQDGKIDAQKDRQQYYPLKSNNGLKLTVDSISKTIKGTISPPTNNPNEYVWFWVKEDWYKGYFAYVYEGHYIFRFGSTVENEAFTVDDIKNRLKEGTISLSEDKPDEVKGAKARYLDIADDVNFGVGYYDDDNAEHEYYEYDQEDYSALHRLAK